MVDRLSKYYIGEIGESLVEDILKGVEGIRYIPDVYTEDKGRTTQIDFIVIAKSGIHVIEVKNIKGLVVGEMESVNWAVINKGRTFSLYNPVLQNSGHVRAIRRILGTQYRYISYVVFSDETQLKVDMDNVGYFSDLWKHFDSEPKDRLTDEEVSELYYTVRDLASENRSLSMIHNRQQTRYLK